jgi:hypothetical protein
MNNRLSETNRGNAIYATTKSQYKLSRIINRIESVMGLLMSGKSKPPHDAKKPDHTKVGPIPKR